MKASLSLLAATLAHFAHCQSSVSNATSLEPSAAPSALPPLEPGPAGDPSDPTVGGDGSHCVTGATYCGYILLENQGFDNETIKAAYCSWPGKCDDGDKEDGSMLAVGVEDSAWLSTLYVCLPPGAVPKVKGGRMQKQQLFRRQIPGVCEDEGPRKLEPLVYCQGEGAVEEVCLNPEGDHIGRCKIPGNTACV